MTTVFYLIRHGESEWNREGRLQGQAESHLTEKGKAQALAAAQGVRDCGLQRLFCSDLVRATETCEPVAAVTGIKPVYDRRLRERHFGHLQGLLRPEAIERYPEEIQMTFESRDADFRPAGGGESRRDKYERVVAFFEEKAMEHPGETIGVVTHGGILDAFFRHVVGIPLDVQRRFVIRNAALNRVLHDESGWFIDLWGQDTAGLSGIGDNQAV